MWVLIEEIKHDQKFNNNNIGIGIYICINSKRTDNSMSNKSKDERNLVTDFGFSTSGSLTVTK